MKALLITLALICTVSSAQAAGLSCGQLVSYKNKLANDLNWIREKMKSTTNSDKIEFYMNEYEEIYARYQAADKELKNNCQ